MKAKPSQRAIAEYKRHHRKHGDTEYRNGVCLLSLCAVHYPEAFVEAFPRHVAPKKKRDLTILHNKGKLR